jgi:hypothetical protein
MYYLYANNVSSEETKLYRPTLRPGLAPRQRLLQ